MREASQYTLETVHHYAPDDIVRQISNAGDSGCQYIFFRDECRSHSSAAICETNLAVESILRLTELRGKIYFAMSVSTRPIFIYPILKKDIFVVIFASAAFYYLLQFCSRIQTLKPLSTLLNLPERPEPKNYTGKLLLDIGKDMVFHTPDVRHYIMPGERSLYRAALLYIVGHEIAHAANGHLDYINSKWFGRDSDSEELRLLSRQAMEIDADCTAAEWCIIDSYRYGGVYKDYTSADWVNLHWRHYRKDKLSATAGILCCLMFHDIMTTNYFPKTYPLGYPRFLAMSSSIQNRLEHMYPRDKTTAIVVREALCELFAILSETPEGGDLGYPMFSNVMVIEDDIDNPTHTYDYIGEAMAYEYLTPARWRWSKIKSYLNRFNRGGRIRDFLVTPRDLFHDLNYA